MRKQEHNRATIMRLFQVKAKSGCVDTLLHKFATTSADVVQHEPGNEGYFFGGGVETDGDLLIFASLWKDLDAVKQRFGDQWQVSFLPEGYEDLIEEHSLCHIDISTGWRV